MGECLCIRSRVQTAYQQVSHQALEYNSATGLDHFIEGLPKKSRLAFLTKMALVNKAKKVNLVDVSTKEDAHSAYHANMITAVQ